MNQQTDNLFGVRPPNTAPYIRELLDAYRGNNSLTQLDLNLYPEPYYGNFQKSSLVLLTHNPGSSDIEAKGDDSPFSAAVFNYENTPGINYFNMASPVYFPNQGTNAWFARLNKQVKQHFEGLCHFDQRIFVRDLLPYHSNRFGTIDMSRCVSYLYTYFFNQVIEASFRSELYQSINANRSKPATIIYARGKAWKDKQGLSAIGWDRIGKLFNYGYVYKANWDKIRSMVEINPSLYPAKTIKHDVYILVITPIRIGAPFGLYEEYRVVRSLINLNTCLDYYYNIKNSEDGRYIKHTEEMDAFMGCFG